MKKKKGLLAEFRDFISRGNVLDLAIGVIMGAAFTAIVNSLVKEIITPILSIFIGGINFESLKIVLSPAQGDIEESAIHYGLFIQQVITFLMTAFVIFFLLKAISKLQKKKDEPVPDPKPAEPSEEVLLLREIRDGLKK